MNRSVQAGFTSRAIPLWLALATLGGGGAGADGETLLGLLLAAIMAIWMLLSARGESRTLPKSLAIAGWVMLLLLLLSALVAPYKLAASLSLLRWAVAAVLFVMAGSWRRVDRVRVFTLLLAVAGLHGAAALWLRLSGVTRPATTFQNPNHLAAWLAVIAIATLFLLPRPNLYQRIAWGLAIAGVWASGSRGGWASLAFGLALFTVFQFRRWDRQTKRRLTIAALSILIAGMFLLAGRAREADPFRWQRVRIWRAVLEASLEQPWTGMGPAQFASETDRFRFPDNDGPLRYDRRFSNTHSDILRVAVELGWPLVWVLLISLIMLALPRLREAMRDPEIACLLAAVAGWLVVAAVDNPTQRPALAGLAAVTTGMLAYRGRSPRASSFQDSGRIPKLVLTSIAIVVFLGIDVSSWRVYRASTSTSVAAFDREAERWPTHADIPRRRVGLFLETPSQDKESWQSARQEAQRWTRLQPNSVESWKALARVERYGCQYVFTDLGTCDRAARAYERAVHFSPYDVFLTLEHSTFQLSIDRTAAALRAADRAVRLEPQAAAAWLVRADIRLATEPVDYAGARRDLARARDAATRNAGAWVEREDWRVLLTLNAGALARVERKLGGQPQ